MIVIRALRLFPAVFCHNPNRPLQKKNENGDSLPKVNLQRNLYNIKKLFMKKKKKKQWKFWKKMMAFQGF
jgi:hypothetical protein